MKNTEKIEFLEEFKRILLEWDRQTSPERKQMARTEINRKKRQVRQILAETRCYKTFTISPPPAIGGMVMRDADGFELLFEPPYLMSFVQPVIDMIDESIGVLSSEDENDAIAGDVPIVSDEIDLGYAFVAMPMDAGDPGLEDVLDTIKETCHRCGIQAERVDDPESNERITDRILESIRRAEYVIVDLTNSKPNVFYEAGYAQGREKTPIYIARSGTQIEFDLKDYPIIFFENMRQLKDGLENRLRGLATRVDN